MTRLLFGTLMASLFILACASCGSKNAGVEGFPALNEASHASSGVSLGGFEVIRHNEAGNPDPTLNSTLSLRMEDSALVISVDDSERTEAVTLDVSYDAAELCPQRAEFHGLLGDGTQVLSLSVLDHAERIALGEAAIGGYVPAALKGDFATLHYTAGPARNVSAMGNFAHSNPAGVAEVIREIPNLVGVSDTDAETATVTWTAGWHVADGDSNSEVNAADIVPIAQKFGASTGTDWSSVVTDYDRNTETGAPDLQPIALYYTNKTVEYLVEASDDADGAARTTVATLNFVTDQQAKTTPVTAGDLRTIYPWYQVVFNASSAMTYETLNSLDANENESVRVWITPSYPTGLTTTGTASFVTLTVGTPEPEVVITGIDVGLPATVVLDQEGDNYLVLLTERSVDSVAGNVESFTYESIPLEAAVTTSTPVDPPLTAEDLIWSVVDGGGLAEVSNEPGEKGTLTFHNRGLVTVEARAPGSFLVTDTISFLLLSIDSLELELTDGGTGPVDVTPGSTVGFKAIGTFAVDTTLGPVTKTLEITPYVGWGVLNPMEAPYVLNTATGELILTSTPSGVALSVTCEFPLTDNVTLYDNQKRSSNFVDVTTT